MISCISRPLYPIPLLVGIKKKGRGQLKCDGTRAETRFRLLAKRTSPFKSAGGRQFSRLLSAEVCASAVVMLDTPCSEVVWRVLATHSICQFPFTSPPCGTVCHHISTGVYTSAVVKIRLDHMPCAVSAVRYLRTYVPASVIMSPSVSRFLCIISNQSAASFDQNQASWDVIRWLSSYLLPTHNTLTACA